MRRPDRARFIQPPSAYIPSSTRGVPGATIRGMLSERGAIGSGTRSLLSIATAGRIRKTPMLSVRTPIGAVGWFRVTWTSKRHWGSFS